jgi:hypothetical protein
MIFSIEDTADATGNTHPAYLSELTTFNDLAHRY